MRLLRVELRRVLARKIIWLAVAAAVAVSLMALFGVHMMATDINNSRANAQEMLEEARTHWEQMSLEDYEQCKRDEADYQSQAGPGEGEVDFGCEQMRRPPVLSDFIPQMPSLANQYAELLGYLVYPFLFLALAVGSTSVAAEFTHRTMGSWLTFVPRRVPVFLAKVGAAALAALPILGAGLLVVLLGVPAVFRWHGIDDGVSGPEWTALAWEALRIVGLGVMAGAFGAAAAFLLRHSAAVLGLMVGYLLIAEGILRGLRPAVTPYLLGVSIEAFVQHGTSWQTWPATCDDVTVPCQPTVHEISFTHGTTVLLVVLVAVVALALVRFQRADVD